MATQDFPVRYLNHTHGRHAVNTSKLQVNQVKTKITTGNTCDMKAVKVRFARHSFLLNCDGDAWSRHCRRKTKKKSSLHCFASHPTGHASVSSKWVGAGTSHGPAHQEESQKHLVSHLPWWAVGKFGVLTPGSQNSFGNSTIHG